MDIKKEIRQTIHKSIGNGILYNIKKRLENKFYLEKKTTEMEK